MPVSVRTADERGALGNRLTQVVAPLPVGVATRCERLARDAAAMPA